MKPCIHPLRSRKIYLDSTVICRECGCIIAQYGIFFDRPKKLWRAKKVVTAILLLITITVSAQFKTNTLYATLQPIDMGLGLRYDKQLSAKYGAYTSLAHGNYRFGQGAVIPHHVRAVIGALRYEKQCKVDYFIWGAGLCFSRTGEGNVIIMDMPSRAMYPVSFEIVAGALAGRWAIGFRYDPLKNESAMDLGIRF